MAFIIKTLSLLFCTISIVLTEPQFGGGGSGNVTAVNVVNTFASDAQVYTPKITALVDVVRDTLTDMGNIALADNCVVGRRIVGILQVEIAKANTVLVEWTAKTNNVAGGERYKREVVSPGKSAHNEVGEILVGSNDKIAADKGKLSPDAQQKIDKAHENGVAKCDADPCKNDRAIKNKLKGAQRQG